MTSLASIHRPFCQCTNPSRPCTMNSEVVERLTTLKPFVVLRLQYAPFFVADCMKYAENELLFWAFRAQC